MAKLGMKLRSGVQSLHVSSFICLLLTVSPLIAKRRITEVYAQLGCVDVWDLLYSYSSLCLKPRGLFR